MMNLSIIRYMMFPHSLGIHSLLFNYYEHIFILHDFMDPNF